MRMYLVLVLALAACKSDKQTPAATPGTGPAPATAPSQPAADPAAPAPAKPDVPAAARDPKAIDSATAREMIDKGAIVLDVRSQEEFGDDHVKTAVNIPVQEFGARIAEVDKLAGGDKSKPIVVYCAAGGRAAKAKAQLDAAGYTNVVNGGGLDDLQ